MSESAQQPDQEPQESVTIDVAANSGAPREEARVTSRFVSTVNKYREGLLDRPIRYDILSIIFTIVIFVGGLYGYISKGSTMSLVSGIIFSIMLAIGTYLEGTKRNPILLIVSEFTLVILMAYRFAQSYYFLPAGLIGLLALIMFARHVYLYSLRRKSANEAQTQNEPNSA